MRIRTIKPEFFNHSGIYDAEAETGLPLRIAYVGLWCTADREGRFRWEPRRLKVAILPYDDVDFSRVLDALSTRGFVMRYTWGTREFGLIPSFKRHQVINNREKDSELPEPSMEADPDACPTRAPRVPHACPTRGKRKGREGKGKEGERKGKDIPEDVVLSDDGVCAHPFSSPSVVPRKGRQAKATCAEECEHYARSIGCAKGQGDAFFDRMEGVGWMVGGKPIKDWEAVVRSWHKQGYMPVAINLPHKAKAEEEWTPPAFVEPEVGSPAWDVMRHIRGEELPDEIIFIDQHTD